MTILSDKEIIDLSKKQSMINPFQETLISKNQNGDKVISYGTSSYGYDSKVSDEFYLFTDINNEIVDPKNFSKNNLVYKKTDICIIPPNSFALASTSEYFKIPKDVLVLCVGKSTYARCGVIINVTPLEPEWEGNVTIEISNTTRLPVKIYANEGICQFLFFQGKECLNTYKSRKGKYQNQKGITLPIV